MLMKNMIKLTGKRSKLRRIKIDETWWKTKCKIKIRKRPSWAKRKINDTRKQSKTKYNSSTKLIKKETRNNQFWCTETNNNQERQEIKTTAGKNMKRKEDDVKKLCEPVLLCTLKMFKLLNEKLQCNFLSWVNYFQFQFFFRRFW